MLPSDPSQQSTGTSIPVLEVTGIAAKTFEVILDYAYTSRIAISAENAEAFLKASYRLEVSVPPSLCMRRVALMVKYVFCMSRQSRLHTRQNSTIV